MIRKIVVALPAVVFVLSAVPSLSAVAGDAGILAPAVRYTDSARAVAKPKQETARISEKRAPSEDGTESVDCFYESNRSHQDCSESKTVTR